MRKFANVKNNDPKVKRLIVYETDNGTYVFPCATLDDGSGMGDNWFENLDQADKSCAEIYGVCSDDWVMVDDPQEGCQYDWLAPVRVKEPRPTGHASVFKLERYENGQWIEFEHRG